MADATPLSSHEPRELASQSKLSKWILQGTVVGLVASLVVVVAGAGAALSGIHVPLTIQTAAPLGAATAPSAAAAAAATCPPKPWIYNSLAGGHWIINSTDPESWGWYMEFLNVNKKDWPAEFHATDMHQYIFFTNASGIFYIMNHTIPSSGFHLLFEADSNGQWRPNPYPVLTPAGFDPSSAKVDLKKVRYLFEEPGVPFADSCYAWRCDMPMVKNVTIGGKLVEKEFVVSFWRELTSPTEMRCTLYITEADTGESIAPWTEPGYGLKPADAIPGHPKRLSYRYFRKTVQSLGDALERLPCKASGLAEDNGQHEFC